MWMNYKESIIKIVYQTRNSIRTHIKERKNNKRTYKIKYKTYRSPILLSEEMEACTNYVLPQ